MASTAAVGKIKHAADERTVAVLEGQGRSEAVEELQTTGPGSPRDLWHTFAATSVMLAGVAELFRDEIAELKEEIAELKAAKPAAPKPAAKKK